MTSDPQQPHTQHGTPHREGGQFPTEGVPRNGSQQPAGPYQGYQGQNGQAQGYQQPGYPTKAYQQNGHAQQGYPQNGHVQQGYPQNGQAQQGYQQNGHVQPGYPQNGHVQPGYPQNGHAQQGYPQNGYQRQAQRSTVSPVGAIVMLVGAGLCLLSTFLPWLEAMDWGDSPEGGIETWTVGLNGWTWAFRGFEYGNILGYMLFFALMLAVIGSGLVIYAGIRQLKGPLSLPLIWAGTILGLLGTVGTALYVVYLTMTEGGGLEDFFFGFWLYSISFLIVLVGAILSQPRKAPVQQQMWNA